MRYCQDPDCGTTKWLNSLSTGQLIDLANHINDQMLTRGVFSRSDLDLMKEHVPEEIKQIVTAYLEIGGKNKQ